MTFRPLRPDPFALSLAARDGAVDRRTLFRAGALGLGALATLRASDAFAQSLGVSASLAPATAASCTRTDANIEGPYYLRGAPLRADLVTAGVVGTSFTLEGRVLGARCRPLRGARIDVWQADATGAYDLRGSRLRGTLRTDDQGRYRLHTIVPGRYLDGARYRPAHIHVKVHVRGATVLTTQLYFEGDPYNVGDPYFLPSLLLHTESVGGGLRAQRDLVVA